MSICFDFILLYSLDVSLVKGLMLSRRGHPAKQLRNQRHIVSFTRMSVTAFFADEHLYLLVKDPLYTREQLNKLAALHVVQVIGVDLSACHMYHIGGTPREEKTGAVHVQASSTITRQR